VTRLWLPYQVRDLAAAERFLVEKFGMVVLDWWERDGESGRVLGFPAREDPADPVNRPSPTGPAARQLAADLDARQVPSDPGDRGVAPDPGDRAVAPDPGDRAAATDPDGPVVELVSGDRDRAAPPALELCGVAAVDAAARRFAPDEITRPPGRYPRGHYGFEVALPGGFPLMIWSER
jgi:hypothetical protein